MLKKTIRIAVVNAMRDSTKQSAEIFVFSKMSRPAVGPTQHIQGAPTFYRGTKRPGSDVHQLLPS
jgi:hypothetical protein